MELTDNAGQKELSSVAHHADLCLQLFENCLRKASSIGPKQLSLVDDQVAKFCVWKDSAGIHSKGRGSLDYRLRDAPNARDIVIGLLEGLSYRLEYCMIILDSTETVEAENEVASAEKELQHSLREIGNEIDLFHNFVNTVRRASRQSQNQKALRNFRIRDDDSNDLEPFLHQLFANYIWDRFPGTPDSIRKRLADTMLIRRKRILYRRSRYGETSNRKPKSDGYEIRRPISVMRNQSPRSSARKTQNWAAHEVEEKEIIESYIAGDSIAPTATTLESHDFQKALAPSVISVSNTVPLSNQSGLPFPPSPCDAINRQYEKLKMNGAKDQRDILDAEKQEKLEQIGQITCQYCFLTLPAQAAAGETKWRLHVKEDLDPYVCLFESCPLGEQLYSHSQEWLGHMEDHCLQWFCNAKSHGKLLIDTKQGYVDHIKAIHPGKFTDAQIGVLADRNVKSLSPMFSSCPLCGVAEENMEDHIVDHMRLLALRSLPPYQEVVKGLEDSYSQASVSVVITNQQDRSTLLDDIQERLSTSDFAIDSEHSHFQAQVPSRPFRGSWTGHQMSGKDREKHDDYLGGDHTIQPADVPNIADKGFLHVLDFQNLLVHQTNATMIGAYEPTAEFFDERLFDEIPEANKRAYEWGFLPGICELWKNSSQDPILHNLQKHMIGEEREGEARALDETTNASHEENESLSTQLNKASAAITGIQSSIQTTTGQQKGHLVGSGDGSQVRDLDHDHVAQLEPLEGPDSSIRTPEKALTNDHFGRARSLLKGLQNQYFVSDKSQAIGITQPVRTLYGLPEEFLDLALLWQPPAVKGTYLQKRTNDRLPSWSWVGWEVKTHPDDIREGAIAHQIYPKVRSEEGFWVATDADISLKKVKATSDGEESLRPLILWYKCLEDASNVYVRGPSTLKTPSPTLRPPQRRPPPGPPSPTEFLALPNRRPPPSPPPNQIRGTPPPLPNRSSLNVTRALSTRQYATRQDFTAPSVELVPVNACGLGFLCGSKAVDNYYLDNAARFLGFSDSSEATAPDIELIMPLDNRHLVCMTQLARFKLRPKSLEQASRTEFLWKREGNELLIDRELEIVEFGILDHLDQVVGYMIPTDQRKSFSTNHHDFILLSEAQYWGNEQRVDVVDFPLFNVMAVEWDTRNEFATRLGLGKIAKPAWQAANSGIKRVILK